VTTSCRLVPVTILIAANTCLCTRREKQHEVAASTQEAGPLTTASSSSELPAPPRGMVWIEPGPLVVGTPPNVYPRRPDRELAGEQFVLHGFYIDAFPYPNEEGAIPMTNVGQTDAQGMCTKLGKRLCSELEWERACKGPSQHTYAYGDLYREETCGTGTAVVPRPSGIRVGCQSDFGVHDLHGGVFEWTDSAWTRGSGNRGKVAVRGGNDAAGEVVSRCANAEPRSSDARSQNLGFRCCSGPPNEVQIQMRVEYGPAVTATTTADAGLLRRMLDHLPADTGADLRDYTWNAVLGFVWRPIGNERLVAISMCARRRGPQRCAVLVGRDTPGMPTVLAVADTGFLPSKLYPDESPRDVWTLGTDASGPLRRLLRYNWGHVDVGPRESQSAYSEEKKRRKRSKKAATSH
jgi:formylglycine-generating enzyme